MSDELELDWGGRAPRKPNEPEAPQEPGLGPSPRGPTRGGPPWQPDQMPDDLRFRVGSFFTSSSLRVSQAVEMAQVLVGWDQANRYSVRGDMNEFLFTAAEQGQGLGASLSRNLNPFHRNTTDCLTAEGSLFLRCTFPFSLWLRRCEVLAWDETPLGTVQNRFHLLKYRADLLNPQGAVLLEVHGPVLKFLSFTDWVFEVRKGDRVVARIKKHWGGWFKEVLTTSDRLSVEFEPDCTDPRLRQLIFAATLLVDLSAFEQRKRHRGSGLGLLSGLLE